MIERLTVSLVYVGCAARNCDDCFPHNPVSCANCSLGYYSLQKRIMGNVKCVRQCPTGFTPTVKNDGKKICKDTQSSNVIMISIGNRHRCLFLFTCFVCLFVCPGQVLRENETRVFVLNDSLGRCAPLAPSISLFLPDLNISINITINSLL